MNTMQRILGRLDIHSDVYADVRGLMRRMNSDMGDHDGRRFKLLDVDADTKVVEWVTQTTSMNVDKVFANELATALKSRGIVGWTIRVACRDRWKGSDETVWKTARS